MRSGNSGDTILNSALASAVGTVSSVRLGDPLER